MNFWKFACALGAAAVLLGPMAAQNGSAPRSAAKAAKPWTMPRTPDGHPDLQGFWTNATFTPLERPADLGNKEFFTEQEAVAYARQREQKENSQAADDLHYDNVLW